MPKTADTNEQRDKYDRDIRVYTLLSMNKERGSGRSIIDITNKEKKT